LETNRSVRRGPASLARSVLASSLSQRASRAPRPDAIGRSGGRRLPRGGGTPYTGAGVLTPIPVLRSGFSDCLAAGRGAGGRWSPPLAPDPAGHDWTNRIFRIAGPCYSYREGCASHACFLEASLPSRTTRIRWLSGGDSGDLDVSQLIQKTANYLFFFGNLVEPSGIEPLTSCMPCRRSPS
jgi:hypothetical protein